eukprot:2659383-Rhodomonas_salina.1
MGKVDRGQQRARELRNAEGGRLSCSVGGLHGWRSLWLVEQGAPNVKLYQEGETQISRHQVCVVKLGCQLRVRRSEVERTKERSER